MAENKRLEVLRRRSEFLTVQKTGRRINPVRWLTLCFQSNDSQAFRYGITASRKVGSAVIRNRLKRLCREYFRKVIDENNQQYGSFDIVVIFKPMPDGFYKKVTMAEISEVLGKAIGKMPKPNQ